MVNTEEWDAVRDELERLHLELAEAAIARVRARADEPVPADNRERGVPAYVRGYTRCFALVLRALDGAE